MASQALKQLAPGGGLPMHVYAKGTVVRDAKGGKISVKVSKSFQGNFQKFSIAWEYMGTLG